MEEAGATDRLKRTVKRSRLGVICGRIGAERVRDLRRAMGRKENPMGATHRGIALEDSLDYIDSVFADYERYAGLTGEAIEGEDDPRAGTGGLVRSRAAVYRRGSREGHYGRSLHPDPRLRPAARDLRGRPEPYERR